MNIKNYINFINENIEEIELKYFSDNIRFVLLEDTINDNIIDSEIPSEEDIEDSLWNQEGIFCYNRPDGTIEFYEYWIKSCYDGLFAKPEYKNLSKEKAVDLFMKERFSLIAKKASCEIIKYDFINETDEYKYLSEFDDGYDTLIVKMKKI